MKKALLTIILIIILVCINWLSEGYAQITADQISAYQELIKSRQQNPGGEVQTYTSPPIYNESGDNESDSLSRIFPNLMEDSTQSAQKKHRVDFQRDQQTLRIPQIDSTSATAAQNQLILPGRTEVRQFGYDFFLNSNLGESNDALVSDDYLLGPGDNIIISLWGRVQQEWNLTVDRQGKIFIPKVGEITAWGMTIMEFERHLDTALSQVYTGYKRKVTLGKIRAIKVFVYGEVKSPGGYSISALSTLFNALYRAGGPTKNGSMRRIKLIRNNTTKAIDLYDFLIAGDKNCDVPLMSGDVVFVPLAGAQATVRGEVKRPAIYELADEEKISDLIELAGGPTANAYLGRLMLDRISDEDSRKIIDIDFGDSAGENTPLVNGDELSVFSMYAMRQNVLWITGMIKHPGTFERTDSMRVSDLIEKGQLLSHNVFMDRADLFRKHNNGSTEIIALNLNDVLAGKENSDIMLSDLDSIHVYDVNRVEPSQYVYIDGLVQAPGQYRLYENMTVNDLIFQAGNLKESAYMLTAELARIDSLGRTNVLYVQLDNSTGKHLPLCENDQLFIRKIPGYQLHRTVTIEGEVNFPGVYSLTQSNETLWQLLHRAGGFTDMAFPIGTVCKRKAIVDDLYRKDISNILAGSQPLLADSTGILRPVQSISLRPESMDRIIIDMETLMATNGAQGDFKLQTGDYIYIPEIPSGISILGETSANGTIRYEEGKKVKDYINKAGGFTKRADKGETRLVKANGQVYSDGGVLSRRVNIGDVIVVPSEIKKEKDWFKFISTSLSILTGVATTVLIVDRL